MLQRYYTHWELHNMIFAIVRAAGNKGITRAEICAKLGRSKAPHIVQAIEDTAARDMIVRVDLQRGSQPYYVYYAPEAAVQAAIERETAVDKR
jgi:hypothetical protein